MFNISRGYCDIFLAQEVTKYSFRQKVWDYLMKNDLVNFPLPVYDRIPNFKGAIEAAQRLAELDNFKQAKIIKINPDKPQEPVRFLALVANKEILVPIPKLRSGLFLHITPIAGASKNELRMLSKIHGLTEVGKPLDINSKIKVYVTYYDNRNLLLFKFSLFGILHVIYS